MLHYSLVRDVNQITVHENGKTERVNIQGLLIHISLKPTC